MFLCVLTLNQNPYSNKSPLIDHWSLTKKSRRQFLIDSSSIDEILFEEIDQGLIWIDTEYLIILQRCIYL